MSVETKEQLFALIRGHGPRVREFGVKRCEVFGSFVRGDSAAHSDVDFLVEFDTGKKTFDNFIRLAFFLSSARSNMSPSAPEYLQHILDEALYLLSHAQGIDKDAFLQDPTLKRAFVRSIEIIGEAAKQVPEPVRQRAPQLDDEGAETNGTGRRADHTR